MKLTGAALVILGGFWFFWEYSRSLRREVALLRDLSGALTQLAGEIRWKNLTLPEGIKALRRRKWCGVFFQKVDELLESKTTLQSAWYSTFISLPNEVSEILCDMEWGGDLPQQEGSILYAARRMTELSEAKRSVLRQREKICAAAALSAAGMVVMILM